MKNDIFWSEVGEGFGEPGGTPHQEFPGVPPPSPPGLSYVSYILQINFKTEFQKFLKLAWLLICEPFSKTIANCILDTAGTN